MVKSVRDTSDACFGNDLKDTFGGSKCFCVGIANVPNGLEFGQHQWIEMGDGPTDFHLETLELSFQEGTLHFEVDVC